MGVQEKENKDKGIKISEEIIASDFPNLMEKINLHIQKAPYTPNKINSETSTSGYIIEKLSKVKDIKHLENSKRKVTY